MKSSFRQIFFVAVVLLGSNLLEQGIAGERSDMIRDEVKKYCSGLPFQMPEIPVPVFPDRSFTITEFGAVADGKTLNTKAIADAIAACVQAGGGKVVIPAGTWLTGPIELESNVNLYLERGALVQFSSKIEDFPLIAGFDGKSKKFMVTPPVHAHRAKNIAITGDGIFDGAGEVWRYVKKEKQTEQQWKKLINSGGVVSPDGKSWWPSQAALDGENYISELEKSDKKATAEDYAKAKEFLRPDLVRLSQCDGILLDGPVFRNSPRFHVYPVQSENIIVRNITIQTQWYAQNGDGLDFGACRNIVVYNTTVDAGDDGICIKPARIASWQKPGPACENIVIADCIVYHGHGGFVIGSEGFGGARNISVKNCTFIGTDVGLRFKSGRGRGGLVENIYIEGIQMRGIENEAILFDTYYGEGDPESTTKGDDDLKKPEPVTDRTPQFQNFFIKNVVCNGARRAILINGLPEMPVKKIFMENIRVSAQRGVLCVDADSISLKNSEIQANDSPVITASESKNLEFSKMTYSRNAEVFLTVSGEKSMNIMLRDIDLSFVKKKIEYGKNANPQSVIY